MIVYWCPTCGVVWVEEDAELAPLCRHMVIDGPAPTRMEPLPSYHPFYPELVGA